MKRMRVLIVEEEPLIAMDLDAAVTEIVPAVVIVRASVASTKEVMQQNAIDFVFLDTDVTNGKTYEVADRGTGPFRVLSASSPSALPFELRTVPFFPKPFDRAKIERALRRAL